MRKGIVLLFLFFCFNKSLFAFYEFDQKLESAYSSVLALRFNEAENLLSEAKADKPGNDLVKLYSNYIDFIKAFITEERPLFDLLKKNTSERLESLDRDKNNALSPFHLFVQSEMHIQLALVRIKFEENILAANDIRKAYRCIEKNEKDFPDFYLNKKVSGFLHAILGAVPNKYQWIVKWAGMDGDIKKGLDELRLTYDKINETHYAPYKTEILFYTGTIYSALSSSADIQPQLIKMNLIAGSSPLIAYVYSNILIKQGKNDEAYRVLNTAIIDTNSYPFHFLRYKRALTRLRKLDLTADEDFIYFLNNYKGKNNIKSAYQKLAWISLLNNDTNNYYKNMKLCGARGFALLDEDKEADYESKNAEVINIYLLKSRLLFDGGYYKQALSEISSRSIKDFRHYHDQLEVTYRLARIMQMTGKTDKAIEYFNETIKNGASSKYFYAANSALMLGLIYEELKKYDAALLYFNKCLTFEHDLYKNSIDQKAQAGINRIKNLAEQE